MALCDAPLDLSSVGPIDLDTDALIAKSKATCDEAMVAITNMRETL